MFKFPTTPEEMAKNSQVNLSTIYRTMKIFETTSEELTTNIRKTWLVYAYLKPENLIEFSMFREKLKMARRCKKFSRMDEATQQFVMKAYEVHGDKYNYNRVQYVNLDEHVLIKCKMHGEFEQQPQSHLRGAEGCKICASNALKKRWLTKPKT